MRRRVRITKSEQQLHDTYESDAARHKYCPLAHCTPFADQCEYRQQCCKRSALVLSSTRLCDAMLQCWMARTASGDADIAEGPAHVPNRTSRGMPVQGEFLYSHVALWPVRQAGQISQLPCPAAVAYNCNLQFRSTL